MMCNVGGVDRAVRVLVGVVLAATASFFIRLEALRISLFIISALSFASAWFGICFINRLLGINTAKAKVIEH